MIVLQNEIFCILVSQTLEKIDVGGTNLARDPVGIVDRVRRFYSDFSQILCNYVTNCSNFVLLKIEPNKIVLFRKSNRKINTRVKCFEEIFRKNRINFSLIR